jgi:hypothetical protein
MTDVTLSPNGEHIAFMMPWERRLNVFVRNVGENKASRITHAQERDITGWLTDNNGRLRVAVVTDGVNTTLLYRQTEENRFDFYRSMEIFWENILEVEVE